MLDRFHELCLWLDSADRPIRVYLPSTVFITERPKGMTEYAMAKAAAEVLADDLNRSLNNVRIVHTRLPRLAPTRPRPSSRSKWRPMSTPCSRWRGACTNRLAIRPQMSSAINSL